jgi:uncharacterized protein
MDPTADSIKKLLNLKPHPTCGFTADTYTSSLRIPARDLPAAYAGDRALGGVLYFLVTADRGIRLHRIRSDQMYHHYLGDPLEVLLLYADGKSDVRTVGADLAAGMRPQLLIPCGTFHAGRAKAQKGFALLGTSVWLRAEPADVEMGDPQKLMAEYLSSRAAIAEFT